MNQALDRTQESESLELMIAEVKKIKHEGVIDAAIAGETGWKLLCAESRPQSADLLTCQEVCMTVDL